MKYIFLWFALCGLSFTVSGQVGTLKGSVRDTTSKTDLQHAVIYLKDPVKNTLRHYVRSARDGSFELTRIPLGSFIMVVTYPGYVDWIDSVTIGPTPLHLTVSLTLQSKLLEEVVVKARRSPIQIKGDTTEYIADSFHLGPGATVEDMLRIMPGMSVNAKGQITVHGQRVQQVLVDGEEFFGNDPTMATQNLRKEDIAKVQVYDKKSDKATITGIDDGVKQKTVNLVLKDNAKRGVFGELAGGSDFHRYYQGKAMIAHFTGTLKTGALFSIDRTGRGNTTFEEDADFGASSAGQQGIPESIQAAAMFNKKFGTLKSSTASNINYNQLTVSGDSYTGIKYILPDTVYYSTQSTAAWSRFTQQALSSKNEFRIDSFQTLTVNVRAKQGERNSNTMRTGKYLGSDNTTLINTSEQQNNLSGNDKSGTAEIFYKRIFDKKSERFLTLNANLTGYSNHTESYLYNKTTYYTQGTPSGQEVVDQQKQNANRSATGQVLASYVTPLSKVLTLNVNYAFNRENTTQDVRSYENSNGKYDSLNPLYSNKYNYSNTIHSGGTSLSFYRKK